MAAEASVTKVTVYKHYRAKDQLLAACLHALDERFFTWFMHEVEASTDDPQHRLLAVFDVLDQWFRRRDFRGCAFINATVELASPDHPAGEAVMAHKTRCRQYFRALAEAAGLEDPDAISDQWMLLTEGATITALVEETAPPPARHAPALKPSSGEPCKRPPNPADTTTMTPRHDMGERYILGLSLSEPRSVQTVKRIAAMRSALVTRTEQSIWTSSSINASTGPREIDRGFAAPGGVPVRRWPC